MDEERALVTGEIRASGKTITGYAATFGTLSHDLMGFREKVAPGAFTRSLKEGADVVALVEHDPQRLVARVSAGDLDLSEDKKGLRVEIRPTTERGLELLDEVRAGHRKEMSFGFRVRKSGDDFENDVRTLLDVELLDVSAVVFPAYPNTELQARKLEYLTRAAERSKVSGSAEAGQAILYRRGLLEALR